MNGGTPGGVLVRAAGSADRERWDAFVVGHPEASPYQRSAWLVAVEAAYGHRGLPLLAERDGALVGVLPLVRLGMPLMGAHLVSLPFCDLGDALTDSPEVARALEDEARRLAAREGVAPVELRGVGSSEATGSDGGSGEGEPRKVRMLLDLPGSASALWDSFKSKLRSQVRKAEKNGLAFEWGGGDAADEFYAVFCRTMRDLGSPVHSRRWIAEVLGAYGEDARVGLVRHEGQTVGAGLILAAGRTVAIPWASTLREANSLGPNMLLYWKLLEFAADSGFGRFDFGRSTPGEGTYRFKEQWGAVPQPLRWRVLTAGGERPAKGGPPSRLRERVAAAWSCLPLPVANWLGPRVRRYISL